MKSLLYIALFFLFILASCSRHDAFSPTLTSIDSLMESRPDSALKLLQTMNHSKLRQPQEKYLYALLTIESNCRNNQTLTNDSILLPIIDYFHRTNETYWEARAEYNRGHILYNTLHQAGEALESFSRAKTLMEECGNKWWLGRTYARMAYIFHNEGMFLQADSLYLQAQQVAMQINDTILWLETLDRRSIHLIAQGKDYYREAETLLQKACQLAQDKKFLKSKISCMLTLSQLYSYMQDARQALQFAQKAWMLESDTATNGLSELLIGEAYYQLNCYDSATIWLKRIIVDDSSLPIHSAAYMRLAEMAEEQGETEIALEYQKKYHQIENEVQNQSQTTEIQLTEQELLYQKNQDQLKWKLRIYLSIITALLIFSLFIYVLRIKKHTRMQQHTNSLKDEEKTAPGTFDFNQLQIHLPQTPFYAKAKQIIAYYNDFGEYEEHFSLADQDQLLHDINHCTNGFITHLKKRFPALSEDDLRFCSLHLLGLSVQQIAILLEKDRSSVYKREKRILKDKLSCQTSNKLEKVLKNI